MMMTAPSLAAVRETLTGYADRGVFRGIDSGEPIGETMQFTFTWHGGRPLRCLRARTFTRICAIW
jgi:hypothetical protein